jgi:hypothetical protein
MYFVDKTDKNRDNSMKSDVSLKSSVMPILSFAVWIFGCEESYFPKGELLQAVHLWEALSALV